MYPTACCARVIRECGIESCCMHVRLSRIRCNLRMARFYVESFVLVALLSTCCVSGDSNVNGDLVLSKVERAINLESHLVKITTKVTVENSGTKAVDHFHFAVDSAHVSHLAYIAALVCSIQRCCTAWVLPHILVCFVRRWTLKRGKM